MAATVTGVFRIIDRASGPMQRMERQAVKTDLAIRRLGGDLDNVGTAKQVKQLGSTERSMRGMRTENDKLSTSLRNTDKAGTSTIRTVDNLGRSVRNADKDTGRWHQRLVKLGAELISIGAILKALKLPLMGAGIGYLIQLVGSLAGGITALIPQLVQLGGIVGAAPALFSAMGLGMLTVKLATSDLTKALQGNKKALQQLTPEGKAFLATLKSYKPVLKELRAAAQQGLFPGLNRALQQSMAGVPMLKGLLTGEGRSIGGGVAGIVGQLTATENLRAIATLGQQAEQVTSSLLKVVGNLVVAFIHLGVAAKPFTAWLLRTIVGWSEWVKNATIAAQWSGRLTDYFDRTRRALTSVAHILKDTYLLLRDVGHAAADTGNSMWAGIDKALRAWEKWTRSMGGQLKMREYFQSTEKVMSATMKLVEALAKAIVSMGQNADIAGTMDKVTALVPALESALNTFVQTFLPVVVDILGQVLQILTLLTAATGPINILLTMIDRLLHLFNALVDSSKAMHSIFVVLFEITAIGLFIRKVYSLATAFGVLGGAAKAAAASEALAGAGGAAGAEGAALGRLSRLGGIAAGARATGAATTAVAEAGGAGFLSSRLLGMGAGAGAGLRGLGAMAPALGRVAWPIMALLAGYGAMKAPKQGGFMDQVGQGAAGALHSLDFGLTPEAPTTAGTANAALQAVLQGGTVQNVGGTPHRAIGGWLGTSIAGLGGATGIGLNSAFGGMSGGQTLQGVNVASGMAKFGGDSPKYLWQMTGQVTVLKKGIAQLHQINTAASNAAIAGLQGEIQAREGVISSTKRQRLEAQRAKNVRGAEGLLPSFGREYNYLKPKLGIQGAFQATIDDILKRMKGLSPAGKKIVGQATLDWAKQAMQQNPKLKAQYDNLHDGIIKSFEDVHKKVKVVNGNILTGSTMQWNQIRDAMVMPAQQAAQRMEPQFTAIQNQAVGALQAMGYSKAEATSLVTGWESSGALTLPGRAGLANAAVPGYGSGAAAGVGAGASAATSQFQFATGGRIPGKGSHDTVPVRGKAAPGELIVNRHTEGRINRMLAGHGTSLGKEVAAEKIPHSVSFSFPSLFGGAPGGMAHAGGMSLSVGAANKLSKIMYGAAAASGGGGGGAGGGGAALGLGGGWGGLGGGTVSGGNMSPSNFSKTPPIGHGPLVSVPGGPSDWLRQALNLRGLNTPANFSALYTQMMSESGGDPSVVNEWDSNWTAGTPSKGLLQTIDSTFAAHALPGHGNIWNPVDNAASALGYMIGSYGHVVGTGHGYAFGGRVPGEGRSGIQIAGAGGGGSRGGGGGMVINHLEIHHNGQGDTYRQAMSEFQKAWRDFKTELETTVPEF